MNLQWYPGHIARARREIKDHISLVDIVIEIIDARCPMSSINFLSKEIKDKKHLIIVNKIDLADEKKLKKNLKLLESEYLLLDSRDNTIKKVVDKKINEICDDIVKKKEQKGITNVSIKAMVVGMPNVGKSTFINSYVKKKVNKVENTPGVTKRLEWTKLNEHLLLLDTPGVTVPKFENNDVGFNLAIVGSINDDIVEKQDLAYEFLDKIKSDYMSLLKDRYKLKEVDKDSKTIDIMDEIAKNRSMYKKGGNIDYTKVSELIINDFRKGAIGKISLE